MCNGDTVLDQDAQDRFPTTDYEKLYNDILEERDILKVEIKKLSKKIKKSEEMNMHSLIKKNQEKWSRDELFKAFSLLYYSKRAYMYAKDELHYPLPGKNNILF